MAKIANVALTNTFDYWRIQSNKAFDRLSQFSDNNSKLYANTVVANNVLRSSGNTVLGAAGKRTVINGLLSSNGSATVSKNITVSGNTTSNKLAITSSSTLSGNVTIGGANKVITSTGVLTHTGPAALVNVNVSGNTTIAKLIANGALGTTGQILKSNGSGAPYWEAPDSVGSLNGYLQVANALVLFPRKSNPILNGLVTANGRVTVSTNLTVSGNTSSNKSTITNRLISSGNTVLGAAGKRTIINGILSGNGYSSFGGRFDSTGNTNLGGVGKKTIINGTSQANGYLTVTNRFDVSGNTNLGAAGKVVASTGHLNHTGKLSVSTNMIVSGNGQILALGVGTTPSTNGSIRCTENVTAFYSDERLKTIIGVIPDALAKVRSLRGFFFEPNDIAQKFGYKLKREVGVSAQEVNAILPEIIAPAPIDQRYMTVYYEKLVPLLIEAIKELAEEVDKLKAKNNDS